MSTLTPYIYARPMHIIMIKLAVLCIFYFIFDLVQHTLFNEGKEDLCSWFSIERFSNNKLINCMHRSPADYM